MKTRRIISIIGLSLALLAEADGQTAFRRELSIGGSFGMGMSTVSFVPKIQENQLLGLQVGITGRWLTEKNLGLMAEINFSQQGWDEQFDDTQYHYTRRINYVDIPIMTHIYFGSGRIRFIFNLGPKVGYAMSEQTTTNVKQDDALPPNNGEKATILRDKPLENKFAWGICGGPGIELRTKAGYFILEGRYYYALGDIFHSKREDPFSMSSSQVIMGKLTYLIPLTKQKKRSPQPL
ncbi:MAG: PorT family protein [Tannerellaceae bacterium]|jgi:hypothetical protein|nr:PorT family protein [Tannerellaceae bacterium]